MELDDLEMWRVEPLLALGRRERPGDALRPPPAVRAGVAVPEPDDLRCGARGEEDEIGTPGVQRQPLRGPLVRQRTRTERGPVHVTEIGPKRERIDLGDCQRRGIKHRDRRRRE